MYIINNVSKQIRFMNTHVVEKFDRCVHVNAVVPDGINISCICSHNLTTALFSLSPLSPTFNHAVRPIKLVF